MHKHFAIFFQSRIRNTGKYVKEHFANYGWINLLKSIAATKVFDMHGSGLNSIDCTRLSPAFDVLVYASEEKELNEAQAMDYELEKDKHK